MLLISTHTSRVGCDVKAKAEEMGRTTISTHTSRVGCDMRLYKNSGREYISTHTSRVGCDQFPVSTRFCQMRISTHTSRVGCDKSIFTKAVSLVKFLLTHPVWDVTKNRTN